MYCRAAGGVSTFLLFRELFSIQNRPTRPFHRTEQAQAALTTLRSGPPDQRPELHRTHEQLIIIISLAATELHEGAAPYMPVRLQDPPASPPPRRWALYLAFRSSLLTRHLCNLQPLRTHFHRPSLARSFATPRRRFPSPERHTRALPCDRSSGCSRNPRPPRCAIARQLFPHYYDTVSRPKKTSMLP